MKKLIYILSLSAFLLIGSIVIAQTYKGSYLLIDRYIPNVDNVIISGKGFLKAISYGEKDVNFSLGVVFEEPNNPKSKEWRMLNVSIPLQESLIPFGTSSYSQEFLRMAWAALPDDLFEFQSLLAKFEESRSIKVIGRDISIKQFKLVLPEGEGYIDGEIENVGENYLKLVNGPTIKLNQKTIFKNTTGSSLKPNEVLQEGNIVLVRFSQGIAKKVVLIKKGKPKPKLEIIPQIRTQEVRRLDGGLKDYKVDQFIFVGKNFEQNNVRLSLKFNLEAKVKNVYVLVDQNIKGTPSTSSMQYLSPSIDVVLSDVNGTHTVEFYVDTYDYQDKDYPYNQGYFSVEFTSIEAPDLKIKSTGTDKSHRYAIHLPYYPNAKSEATVGAEEYPALVWYVDPSTKEVSVFFTSFTGRFNKINVGLEHPSGQKKQITKDCNGTCPRDVDALIKKFGHPAEWGFLVLKFDPKKTVQNTGKLTMERCYGTLYFDLSRNKNQIMICNNIRAFGNNFGWGRKMVVNINWNYIPLERFTGREELKYSFILPRDIDQHFPPAPRKAPSASLEDENMKLLLQLLGNILQGLMK